MILELYGGVGSGKSVVLQYLKEAYGACVIGMDETAHALYEPGKEGNEAAVLLLGTSIRNPDGTLNRPKMADILYRDPELLKKLNAVIHPLVYREVERRINASAERLTVVETALPSETRSDRFDEIWYVYTPKAVREERLMKNRGYSAERVREIMEKQPSDEKYRALSDWELPNGGTPEEMMRRIDEHLSARGLGKSKEISGT